MRAFFSIVVLVALAGCASPEPRADSAGLIPTVFSVAFEPGDTFVALLLPPLAGSGDVEVTFPPSEDPAAYVIVTAFEQNGTTFSRVASSTGPIGGGSPYSVEPRSAPMLLVVLAHLSVPVNASVLQEDVDAPLDPEVVARGVADLAIYDTFYTVEEPAALRVISHGFQVEQVGPHGESPLWGGTLRLASQHRLADHGLTLASLYVGGLGAASHTRMTWDAFGHAETRDFASLPVTRVFVTLVEPGDGDASFAVEQGGANGAPRIYAYHATWAMDLRERGFAVEPLRDQGGPLRAQASLGQRPIGVSTLAHAE